MNALDWLAASFAGAFVLFVVVCVLFHLDGKYGRRR